jgi:hypothetical protein
MSSLYYLSIQFPLYNGLSADNSLRMQAATLPFLHFCLCFLQSSHDNYRTLVACYGSKINVYVAMLQFTSVERMYFGKYDAPTNSWWKKMPLDCMRSKNKRLLRFAFC